MQKIVLAVLGCVLLSTSGFAGEQGPFNTETEKVSYSIGYQVGGDFRQQGWDIDTEALVSGLRDGIGKKEPQLSSATMDAILVDLKKKLVVTQQNLRREADAKFLAENARMSGVTVLRGGAQYRVLREGTGRKPTLKDSVTILYHVSRTDGTQIGSTVPGEPRTYPMSKATPALQEVLQLMPQGAKWQIVIPPDVVQDRDPLDDTGVIIYDLELVSVQSAT